MPAFSGLMGVSLIISIHHFKAVFHPPIILSLSPEATKITLAPSNADVTAGEDVRMQCTASHDSSLDITFIWSLDGRVIDLHEDSLHYERSPVRGHVAARWGDYLELRFHNGSVEA